MRHIADFLEYEYRNIACVLTRNTSEYSENKKELIEQINKTLSNVEYTQKFNSCYCFNETIFWEIVRMAVKTLKHSLYTGEISNG